MMVQSIHSDTVVNRVFSASSDTARSFKTFGWDSVLQRTSSL